MIFIKDQNQKAYTIDETAMLLSLNSETIRRKIVRKEIECIVIDKQRFITASALKDYLNYVTGDEEA